MRLNEDDWLVLTISSSLASFSFSLSWVKTWKHLSLLLKTRWIKELTILLFLTFSSSRFISSCLTFSLFSISFLDTCFSVTSCSRFCWEEGGSNILIPGPSCEPDQLRSHTCTQLTNQIQFQNYLVPHKGL